MKYRTGDKSLDAWALYYSNKDKSLIKFNALIEKADKSFLFKKNDFPYDDKIWEILPSNGFLEKDYMTILNSMNYDGLVSKEDSILSKTRMILALNSGIKFEEWLDYFGDDFTLVMARALIEGKYEDFDINFEDLAKFSINCGVLTRDDFFGVALMRGNILGKRYPDEKSEKELKNKILKNKLKTKIQVKLFTYI